MLGLMYVTLEDAQKRSHEEALARGCMPPTLYWWALRQFKDETWGIEIGDDLGTCTDDEILELTELDKQ